MYAEKFPGRCIQTATYFKKQFKKETEHNNQEFIISKDVQQKWRKLLKNNSQA